MKQKNSVYIQEILKMSAKEYQPEHYRKYLLSQKTATPHFLEYIENCLASEDEAYQHSFHKIMVHNWVGSEMDLFKALSGNFTPSFIPVNCKLQGAITTFHTSSLHLVTKITKVNFRLWDICNVDILFNDKSSEECFKKRVTIEDIVADVVNNRFNDKFELDLSNLCNDPEFLQNKINFFNINLLSNCRTLMLGMGQDTKCLNLSYNNLCTPPVDLLNFFKDGDLIAINLSNNNIPSLQELHRLSSKIKKLWLEGNPLCDELDASSYVKQTIMKFPELNELDGIRLNEHGVPSPFFKNHLDISDRRTKIVVDNFLSLFFAHFDHDRKHIDTFYDEHAIITFTNNLIITEADIGLQNYAIKSRNLLDPLSRKKRFLHKKIKRSRKKRFKTFKQLCKEERYAVTKLMCNMPKTLHDPTTFTVDVLLHTQRNLFIVVEGVFKDIASDKLLHFRRTFLFKILYPKMPYSEYYITNEMFYVAYPTKEMIEKSFKNVARFTNPIALCSPDTEDVDAICYAFSHVSQLKKSEAKQRLEAHNYDFRQAVKQFVRDFKENEIPPDKFIAEDDSDMSSSQIDEE